jgi:His/Glu/Gln/Arg/opine family amino acid ABC transporter permease subunit
VLGVGYFLVRNTLINLESRNIQTGYHFLWRESGFDISEYMVPYSAANTYARALLVGLLNTLRVAVIGVALATVLGIFVGIGTLSQNWLLARITMGYIHLLRNIPVLLQIILWYTIMINDRFLPNPRQANRSLTPTSPSEACISRFPRRTLAGSRPPSASPSPWSWSGCSGAGPRRGSCRPVNGCQPCGRTCS